MRATIVFVFVFVFASCTRVIERQTTPTPTHAPAPAATPPAPPPKGIPDVPPNHADDLVKLIKPFAEQGIKCKPWTGSGTLYQPGVDSYICELPTSLIWCGAPLQGPAQCVTTLDWTPPQQPKQPQAKTPPQPPKK
jgi:hypothetical protein